MKIIIIEDEQAAINNLQSLIIEIDPQIEILQILRSVSESIEWLKNNTHPDLALCDIKLNDGISFEIFSSITVDFPVIFITAYDNYAIKAFKLNSIDYLLKPVKKNELIKAFEKYKNIFATRHNSLNSDLQFLLDNIKGINKKKYKQSLLINEIDKLIPYEVKNIAYFYSLNEIVRCITFEKTEFIIDINLKELEEQLDPELFYRCNRQYLVSRKAIKSADRYFNGRLKVNTLPKSKDDILISKARSSEFREWLKS